MSKMAGSLDETEDILGGGLVEHASNINWHFWPWCNYGCKFCFARFEDIPRADRLPKEIAITVPEMLAALGLKRLHLSEVNLHYART